MKIAHKSIGSANAPFVIAEMSGNHNQSLERALEIVEAAAKTGAHALKIQTYTPDTMTLDLDEREFHISDPKACGPVHRFTSCTAKPSHLGNGMKPFSNAPKNWASSLSARRLMPHPWTFSSRWMCLATRSPPLKIPTCL